MVDALLINTLLIDAAPTKRPLHDPSRPVVVELTVDGRNLLDKAPAGRVFHVQDRIQRPVEVVGDVCDFLIEAILGVTSYAPPNEPKSKSNSCSQWGHAVFTSAEPSSLIRR